MRDYLEPTWINGRYSILEWNVYGKIIRTNNFAEGNNNKLLCAFGIHPNFDTWINKLKEISALQSLEYLHWKQYKFTKQRSKQEHIKIAQMRLLWRKIKNNEITIMDYLNCMRMAYDGDILKVQLKIGVPSDEDYM